jgi:hypothetical protein
MSVLYIKIWKITTTKNKIEESCMFQKIYGLGKVKLEKKWPGRLEKTQI